MKRFCGFLAFRVVLLVLILLQVGVATGGVTAAEPLATFDFESGMQGWTIQKGMASISGKEAASGKQSLMVVDPDLEQMVAIRSGEIDLKGITAFVVSGMMKVGAGVGGGIRARVFGEDKKYLGQAGGLSFSSARPEKGWGDFRFNGFVEWPEARYIVLEFSTNPNVKLTAFLDDLVVTPLDEQERAALPWPAKYRILPDQKERLTEADVVGPDGLVYPNWRKTGVQQASANGLPVQPVRQYGAVPDDGKDDAVAIENAAEELGARGGGVLQLEAGQYHLDRPIYIHSDNIILRGEGREKTKMDIRYRPERGLAFYRLQPDQLIGPDTNIAVHADPNGVLGIKIYLDQTLLMNWEKPRLHAGNRSYVTITCAKAKVEPTAGAHTLRAVVSLTDGNCDWERATTLHVQYDPACKDRNAAAGGAGMIDFSGASAAGEKVLFAADGLRGSREILLQREANLLPGSLVLLRGPETDRWKKLTQNACQWGVYRAYIAEVEKCEGTRLTLTQPLRIDFPLIDESYLVPIRMLSGCGVEGLSIEQTHSFWFDTIRFNNLVNSYVRNVRVTMSGRSPFQAYNVKWCTVSDAIFDDSWHKGGGGTAYVGWEHAYDCLMENVTTYAMRHAPLLQWSASGCVIRNGTFHDSDAQWHSGWTNENLLENCVVTSVLGNGGYGYGMWASPPEDGAHGPNGPRNVVYRCDVTSPKDGLWMGGMNENWMILYNRFSVEKGAGVFAKNTAFHQVIRGNVFRLADANSPMVLLRHPDCVGAWVEDNRLYGGNGEFVSGMGKPEKLSGNQALPLQPEAPRPEPAVPSIYEWQQKNVR